MPGPRLNQTGFGTLLRLRAASGAVASVASVASVALVALVALVASCGTPVVPSSGNPTTSTTTAGRATVPTATGTSAGPCGVVASAGVVVTGGTEPCRVSAHVGVNVAVILDPGFDWDNPSSDSGAVEVIHVARQPSGRLDAELVATHIGQATVSATGTVLCPAERACPALARLWQLHVTVGPQEPSGPG